MNFSDKFYRGNDHRMIGAKSTMNVNLETIKLAKKSTTMEEDLNQMNEISDQYYIQRDELPMAWDIIDNDNI